MLPFALVVLSLLPLALSAAPPTDDWHTQLIGPPSVDPPASNPPFSRFLHVSTAEGRKRSLALTLTDRDVLAALDPANGGVVWRQRYAEEERPLAYYTCGDTVTVVAAKRTSSLSARAGAVRWVVESGADEEEEEGAVDSVCWDTANGDVVTLSNGVVQRVSGGNVVWTWKKENANQRVLRLARTSDSHLSVFLLDGPILVSHHLDSTTGSLLSTASIKVPAISSPSFAVVPSKDEADAAPTLVWIANGALKSTVSSGSSTFSPIASFSEGQAVFDEILDVGLRHRGVFVARRADGSAIAFGAEKGEVKLLWNFHERAPGSLFAGFVDRNKDVHVGLLTFASNLNLGNLQVLSLKPTAASPTGMVTGHTFPYDRSAFGSFRTFAIEISPQSEYVVATRAIIGTDFGSLQAWTGAKLTWTREEGLATIDVQPVFVDPPERHHLGDLVEAHAGFEERLERHMAAIQVRLSGPPAQPVEVPGHNEDLIVVASSSARSIYALDAAKAGSLAWRATPPLEDGVTLKWAKLQVVDDKAGKEVVAATAILSSPDGHRSTTKVFEFDAFTGALLEKDAAALASPASVTTVEQRGQHLVGEKRVDGRLETLWTFAIPAGEQIHVITPQQLGAVASLGRVLGNRTTLLKYLNPHLVTVVTLYPATTTAVVYVLDSASGALVHKVNLVDGTSDVHVVLQDNWLLVTYKIAGDVARTTRVVSTELYQLEGTKVGDTASSLKAPVHGLQALSRSFASTQELNVVGVTRTKLGITSRNAIFVNGNGQVVTIPRRMLDPRRTFDKPDKDDQEEMLIPYDPILPTDTRWVASHTYDLQGISHVASAPGRRESESLVFAFGLDLFCTRQSPSKSFDVLSPTFNKFQLIITVSILSVALVVTRSMVQSRRIKQKWYSS